MITDETVNACFAMSKDVLTCVFVRTLTDADIETLAGFTQLKILDISGTDVTKVGATRLRRALPDCQIRY